VVFSEVEADYLATQRLARLATAGPDGSPHVVPVGFHVNPALGVIEIGGHALGGTRKFKDVQREPRVSLVIDDLESVDPWKARGIEVRGRAEALNYGGQVLGPGFGPELIRIYPQRVISWGIETAAGSRRVARDISQ
jgi:pyridoxamine 5'-phosphate oxidase family protein